MKWKAGHSDYFVGIKKVKVFAFWPRVLYHEGERYIVWLEYYYRELYSEYSVFDRERYITIQREYPVIS